MVRQIGSELEAGIRRPKIDVHSHVFHMDDPDDESRSADHLVETGDLLGITEFWTFSIIPFRMGDPDEVRAHNDTTLRAMARHPNRIRGMCFVIPGHYQAALDEIDRCLDAGMIGVKLYHQYTMSDPVQWPVIEKCIDRGVPILMHAGYLPNPEHLSEQPLISNGAHFAEAGKRYPEAMLIHAHIGGGGDWEWTVRAMRDAPNVYADASGSNLDDGQVEFAVRELGAERVLFGTDGTMTGCVGKVLDADISEQDRELIFFGNAKRILAAQGALPLAENRQEAAQ